MGPTLADGHTNRGRLAVDRIEPGYGLLLTTYNGSITEVHTSAHPVEVFPPYSDASELGAALWAAFKAQVRIAAVTATMTGVHFVIGAHTLRGRIGFSARKDDIGSSARLALIGHVRSFDHAHNVSSGPRVQTCSRSADRRVTSARNYDGRTTPDAAPLLESADINFGQALSQVLCIPVIERDVVHAEVEQAETRREMGDASKVVSSALRTDADSTASRGRSRRNARCTECWAGLMDRLPPPVGSLPSSAWTSKGTGTPSGTSIAPVASTGPRSSVHEPSQPTVPTMRSLGKWRAVTRISIDCSHAANPTITAKVIDFSRHSTPPTQRFTRPSAAALNATK